MQAVNLGSVYATMELRTSSWNKSMDIIKKDLKNFEKNTKDTLDKTNNTISKRISSIGKSMTSIGKTMSIAVTAPLLILGKTSMDIANEMEVKWKEVEKVYGNTADAFAKDVSMLEKSMDSLSVKFGENKEDVVGILGEIAAMGKEGPEAVDLVTQSLEFAKLGGIGLQESMEGVIAISKIYGATGEDLTDILASLNTVENKTGASMEDLNTAIKIVGSSSSGVGVSVGELSGFIAALRERAIPASEAANGLKTILARTYKTTEDASVVFKKYGISIGETEKVTGKLTRTTGGNSKEVDRLNKKLVSIQRQYKDYETGVSGANLTDEKRKEKLKSLVVSMGNVKTEIKNNTGETESYIGTIHKATGELKDADEILIDVAKSWKKMNGYEKEAVINSMAGVFQRDKFVGIMEDLNSESSTYNTTLNALGNTEQDLITYENELGIALDTNKTKLAQSKVSFDNLRVSVGKILSDIFVPIIGSIARLASRFNNLNPSLQKTIVVFGIFMATIGPVLVILGTLATAVGAGGVLAVGFTTLVSTIGFLNTALIQLYVVLATNPLIAIAIAVTAITVAIGLLIIESDLLKTKHDLVTESERKQKIASDNLAVSKDKVTEASKKLTDAERGVEGATLRVERAQINYDTAVKNYGETSLEAREAEYNLKGAREDQQTATENVNTAVDEGKVAIEEYDVAAENSKKAAEELAKAQEAPETAFGKVTTAIGKTIDKLKEWIGLDKSNGGGGGGGGGGQAYSKGGWIKKTGMALVHEGEYMLSKSMLAGNQPIDSKVALSESPSMNVSSAAVQPRPTQTTTTTNSPHFEVNIGTYAGSPMEKRELARELFESYDDYKKGTGESINE